MSTGRVISRANSLALVGYRHCCHVMLHTSIPEDVKLFRYYPIKNTILMQLRFDGRIGFSGGFVDDGEDLETAVNREVQEEMGQTSTPVGITEDNYVITHVQEEHIAELNLTKKLCLHFYAKEVPLNQFLELERRNSTTSNLDFEVLGAIRCPLYTLRDKKGGLPSFLLHNFVGNARLQLFIGIEKENLLSREELLEAVKLSGTNIELP
ncbi:predicted protein [Nematostella vectensis]|uniref:U8 snoRNA-decapping enzyme n=1 Tax=Nematostella vectensis TaxID=45351 RepID=A7RVT3_NEMVE|nr:U8 snoRNA-decapping enzyme [Nematostella vectensis]EDO44507.1 predicted protein [Nematostella vectensis]|eukprot:XP_001636570.1 predicted protein [Nematostella vectensis]